MLQRPPEGVGWNLTVFVPPAQRAELLFGRVLVPIGRIVVDKRYLNSHLRHSNSKCDCAGTRKVMDSGMSRSVFGAVVHRLNKLCVAVANETKSNGWLVFVRL